MAEGIVAGGGAALLHAEGVLDGLDVNADSAIGVDIVRQSLSEPAYFIAANAGYQAAEWCRPPAERTRVSTLWRAGTATWSRWASSTRSAWSARRCRTGRPTHQPAAHDQHAGRRGADTVGRQRGADDRVRIAGRGPAPAVA